MNTYMCISLSAREISNLIGISVRVVQKRALNDGWAFVEATGRGGKTRKYDIQDLPSDIKNKIQEQFGRDKLSTVIVENVEKDVSLRKQIATDKKTEALKEFTNLPNGIQRKANNILIILQSARDYERVLEAPKKIAWNKFCEDYNNRTLNFSTDIYAQRKTVSYTTLQRWNKAYDKNGLMGLVDKYGKNKGNGIIDSTPPLKDFCIALVHKFPHIKGERIHELLQSQFEDLYTIPKAPTCRDWLNKWKQENKALFMSLHDPSGWQNNYMAAFGSMSAEIERINQLWEFDSTPADVMLTDGRYHLVGVIDVFTRRVKLILCPTSNSQAIALLVREAILDWGKPEIARTDNGLDYLSNHVLTSWDSLGIENDVTNPYSGWEKPFIERFFRTFSHGIAELLDGYIGHNVSDREKISARKTFAQRLMERKEKGSAREGIDVNLNASQFSKFMNQWVESHYHHKNHSDLKCTPFEKFSQHRQLINRLDDERVLDILLAPIPGSGSRKVLKEGIKVEGSYYIHAELGIHIGEMVHCRWNKDDVGKIYVFHALHGHFICEAVNPEIAGNGIRQEHAYEAKRAQRRNLAAQRKAVKQQIKDIDISNQAQKFLDYRTSKTQSLESFPKSSEQAQSAAINSAQDAISSRSKSDTYSEEEKTIFEKRRQEIEERKRLDEEIHKPTWTSEFQRAKYLTEADATASIPNVEKAWLHDYRRKNKRSAGVLDTLKANILRNKK